MFKRVNQESCPGERRVKVPLGTLLKLLKGAVSVHVLSKEVRRGHRSVLLTNPGRKERLVNMVHS